MEKTKIVKNRYYSSEKVINLAQKSVRLIKKKRYLTDGELTDICFKYCFDCHDCPLAIIHTDTVHCLKEILNEEIDVTEFYKEQKGNAYINKKTGERKE